MDIKYLQTFQTILDEGSFTKAASKLNYTQSTITFQIGQLEQELSTTLFEKIGRNMVLTKAGEHLVPYVTDVLGSIEKLKSFEDDLALCQGDLRVGVAETVLCYLMPPFLKEFHKKAPNAKLFLRSMNCYDIRDELMAGTLDIGIFYENVGGIGSHLHTHKVGSYPLCLVASPHTKEEFSDFTTPDQQIPVPFIINETNCIFRQIFEHYLNENAMILDQTIELWSIPTIKNLVKSDMGISFLPRFTVQSELASHELEEIKIPISDTEITAVCGYHKNKWISPLMKLFIELLTHKE